MRVFANKNIWKKLVIILIAITIIAFVTPQHVEASIGGSLAEPVSSLVVTIGDGVVWIVHKLFMEQDTTLIRVNTVSGWLKTLVGIIRVAAIVAASIALAIVTMGASAAVESAFAAAALSMGTVVVKVLGVVGVAVAVYSVSAWGDEIDIPVYSLTPEDIFSGNVAMLNVNFFDIDETETDDDYITWAYSLNEMVSKWYYVLLTMAIVAMLSVLVYVGIRILLSSVASEKAKYKQMLGDWFIGLILLFTMHYIMIFANTISDLLTDYLSSSQGLLYYPTFELDSDIKNHLTTALNKAGYTKYTDDTFYDDESGLAYYIFDDGGTEYLQVTCSQMEIVRIYCNYDLEESESFLGYTVMFAVLCVFLCMFLVMYIKRVILMAFLTIIAPLLAVTYPIDKLNDGSAQGFNMWLKEYIFNLLLQPLHLLLYTVLIGSAIEIAAENFIWCIIVMGFMVSAEKILRNMFNFQKASTPGVLGGAVGMGLVMSGMQRLTGMGPKGHPKGGSGNESSKDQKSPSAHVGSLKYAKNNYGVGEQQTTRVQQGAGGQQREGGQQVTRVQQGAGGQQVTRVQQGAEEQQATRVQQHTTSEIPTTPEPKKKINGKGPLGGIKAGAKYYGAGMKKKASSVLKKQADNAGRNTAKLIAGGLGAATLGTVGAAMGIASGDPSKAIQYASVGGMAGAKFSSNLTEARIDALSVEGTGETIRREAMGEDYINKIADKKQKQAGKDPELISALQSAGIDGIGSYDEAAEVAPEIARICMEQGITDYGEMAKTYKKANKLYNTKGRDLEQQVNCCVLGQKIESLDKEQFDEMLQLYADDTNLQNVLKEVWQKEQKYKTGV